MHNMTPRATAFRAFSSGGARGTIDKAVSWHNMQEMVGWFYAKEHRDNVEHFEPFGYSACIVPENDDGVAEALMHFVSGSRTHSAACIIADRRYRPRGFKPGELSQHDDIHQMSLIRRTGVYLLTQDGIGAATDNKDNADEKNRKRMVSVRHINKSKQPRVSKNSNADEEKKKAEAYKHEGESVNMEVRVTVKRVDFYEGDSDDDLFAYYKKDEKNWRHVGKLIEFVDKNTGVVVGSYDASSKTWFLIGDHIVLNDNSGASVVIEQGTVTSTDAKGTQVQVAGGNVYLGGPGAMANVKTVAGPSVNVFAHI